MKKRGMFEVFCWYLYLKSYLIAKLSVSILKISVINVLVQQCKLGSILEELVREIICAAQLEFFSVVVSIM